MNRHTLIKLFALTGTLLLSACANMAPAPTAALNQNMGWQQRQEALIQLTGWRLSGAIGIRQNSDAWSANLRMQTIAIDEYTLDFIAPLGAGTLKLVGTPSEVTWTDNKGRTRRANNAESLLKSTMGWTLPITNMYFWLRGLPAPGIGASTKFDNVHHLTHLEQQGWRIDYLRYTAAGGLDLPSKVTLKRGDLSIKIVINSWSGFIKHTPEAITQPTAAAPTTSAPKPLINLN